MENKITNLYITDRGAADTLNEFFDYGNAVFFNPDSGNYFQADELYLYEDNDGFEEGYGDIILKDITINGIESWMDKYKVSDRQIIKLEESENSAVLTVRHCGDNEEVFRLERVNVEDDSEEFKKNRILSIYRRMKKDYNEKSWNYSSAPQEKLEAEKLIKNEILEKVAGILNKVDANATDIQEDIEICGRSITFCADIKDLSKQDVRSIKFIYNDETYSHNDLPRVLRQSISLKEAKQLLYI